MERGAGARARCAQTAWLGPSPACSRVAPAGVPSGSPRRPVKPQDVPCASHTAFSLTADVAAGRLQITPRSLTEESGPHLGAKMCT